MYAVLARHTRCIQLLAPVSPLNAVCADGQSALHFAAGAGHKELVSLLLEAGADVALATHRIAVPPISGLTPLHTAAMCGHPEVLKLLLRAGAPRSLPTSNRSTPLIYATYEGHLGCVALLLNFGGTRMPEKEVNMKDWQGYTALACSAMHGCHRTCSALLQAGAKPSIKDGCGKTALDKARRDHPTDVHLHALLRGESPEPTCDACGKRASQAPKGKLLVCTCQGVHYCGKPCQTAAWAGHKGGCKQRRDAHAEWLRTPLESE